MPGVSGVYADKVWAGWENWGGLKTGWTTRPGTWSSMAWSSDGGQEPAMSQYWDWSCLMYVNDLDDGAEYMGCSIPTASVLVTQNWEWQFIHQRNLDRGEVGWKCRVLHLGRNSPKCQYMLTRSQTDGKQLCRRGPGGRGGHQVGHELVCALVAKRSSSTLGCIRKTVASRLRKVVLSLYSTRSYLTSLELPTTLSFQ